MFAEASRWTNNAAGQRRGRPRTSIGGHHSDVDWRRQKIVTCGERAFFQQSFLMRR